MSLETIIRDALIGFIQSHIPNADVSAMDEVFFSYVTGVLEELGSQDSSEEDFDMETFMEMLEGYIPGFAEIGSERVYEMMFELSGRLREARNKGIASSRADNHPQKKDMATAKTTPYPHMDMDVGKLMELVDSHPYLWDNAHESFHDRQKRDNAWQTIARELNEEWEQYSLKARNQIKNCSAETSETSLIATESGGFEPRENRLHVTSEGAEAQEKGNARNNVDVLLEMFPACTLRQAEKVLSMAKGNLEDAVQIIVEEEVPLDDPSELQLLQKVPKKEDLKEFILQKYMLVDDEDDKKTHRPLMPKEAPKKMIRYIDNQVVSTKGERYKDIKKPESEEMKKTYINLKPARKYKFH